VRNAAIVDYLKLAGTASPEPNQSTGAVGTLTGTTGSTDPNVVYVLPYAWVGVLGKSR
jgi:hypothetical protein